MVRQDAQLCYNFFNFSSRFSASCSVPSFFAKWKRIKWFTSSRKKLEPGNLLV